jgi:hypothetical protein
VDTYLSSTVQIPQYVSLRTCLLRTWGDLVRLVEAGTEYGKQD